MQSNMAFVVQPYYPLPKCVRISAGLDGGGNISMRGLSLYPDVGFHISDCTAKGIFVWTEKHFAVDIFRSRAKQAFEDVKEDSVFFGAPALTQGLAGGVRLRFSEQREQCSSDPRGSLSQRRPGPSYASQDTLRIC